jgi:hypothetical protein
MSGESVKGKFYDPCFVFILYFTMSIRCFERFRSGDSTPCVLDILTRHVSTSFPLLPPPLRLPSPLFSSHVSWPTPTASSSMTPPPSSPTSPLAIHSQYPTFSTAGTHAFPSPPARRSPVSRETVPVFMLRPWMVLHFPFSGGVRRYATFFCFRPSSYVSPPPCCTGNGIQLSGIADGNITYDLHLDGVTNSSISPSTSGTTLLAEYDGLQPGNHTLSLVVHNPTNSTSALIAIDHALITVNSTSPKCVPRRSRPQPLVLPRAPWYFG